MEDVGVEVDTIVGEGVAVGASGVFVGDGVARF